MTRESCPAIWWGMIFVFTIAALIAALLSHPARRMAKAVASLVAAMKPVRVSEANVAATRASHFLPCLKPRANSAGGHIVGVLRQAAMTAATWSKVSDGKLGLTVLAATCGFLLHIVEGFELLFLGVGAKARDLVFRPQPAHKTLGLFGGAFLVQRHETGQHFVFGQIHRPAICSSNGGIEFVVEFFQDEDEGVVEDVFFVG